MILEIILDIDWQDMIFYFLCAIVCIGIINIIPKEEWEFLWPLILMALIVIAMITYIIWYLTSYKAGWYDLSYWSVYGIGVGITVLYCLIMTIIDKNKEK